MSRFPKQLNAGQRFEVREKLREAYKNYAYWRHKCNLKYAKDFDFTQLSLAKKAWQQADDAVRDSVRHPESSPRKSSGFNYNTLEFYY